MSIREQTFLDYDGFLDKSKPRKTTDDCHTPPNIYEAIREALQTIHDRVNSLDEECGVDPVEIRDIARAALALPRLNCEVGTAQEQRRRYDEWRNHDGLRAALGKDEFEWAQMPYEEGGEK